MDGVVLFTERYGISGYLDAEPWMQRHAVIGPIHAEQHACVCPGTSVEGDPITCRLRATQEDFLCDPCREHCVAVDSAGVFHHLASLPSARRG